MSATNGFRWQVINERLGGTLEAELRARRSKGESLRQIASWILQTTSYLISHVTVGAWLDELEVKPKPKAKK